MFPKNRRRGNTEQYVLKGPHDVDTTIRSEY